eukprot:scaffold174109_cov30-Tisochrysis_lutea.AAC.6
MAAWTSSTPCLIPARVSAFSTALRSTSSCVVGMGDCAPAPAGGMSASNRQRSYDLARRARPIQIIADGRRGYWHALGHPVARHDGAQGAAGL